jgi:hypothetical protein
VREAQVAGRAGSGIGVRAVMGAWVWVVAASLALAAFSAMAQEKWSQWDIDFDEDKKEWKEIEARMPAAPRPEDLLPFEASGASAHRFFIDARSLSIGEDGVVRYTLVVKTAGGATNTTFEGMRCESREQKYYAVGQPNGGWVRARSPQWRRIEQRELNNHHRVLYADYLCDGRMPVASVREVVQTLKFGSPVK